MCSPCHSTEKDVLHGPGPNLQGIMNASVAVVPEYREYPGAQRDDDGTWTVERLDACLASLRNKMPETTTACAGLEDPEDRTVVIGFPNTCSDSPVEVRRPYLRAKQIPARFRSVRSVAQAGPNFRCTPSFVTGRPCSDASPVFFLDWLASQRCCQIVACDRLRLTLRDMTVARFTSASPVVESVTE